MAFDTRFLLYARSIMQLLFIVDLRDWMEVQLFARFGYGEQCQGAKSGPDARAGKGVR